MLDEFGVIAPWYRELNGPCDLRVRIAAETLKRYPWTSAGDAVASYPHYVFNGFWQISAAGEIEPKTLKDPVAWAWGNGDLGQRATSVLSGMVDYYRYSGDPAAIAHATYMADFIIDHAQTPAANPWPGMFISVPVKGVTYGNADPDGMIQLDIVGSTGRSLLRAYELAGNPRWLEAAKHWGDELAAHCNLDPTAEPWPRYANPEASKFRNAAGFNRQTGGVAMIAAFLDELIRIGYTGKDEAIVRARNAGNRYLRDKLLPAWQVNDSWGRYFWDWVNPVQNCVTTPDVAAYLIDHPREFPNWRNDARNILTLFLNHTSVAPTSNGDVYDGAWAYPESNGCCERSLWYSPLALAPAVAEWAEQADSKWARELAYRQIVLQTYDILETGVTEDNIDGGVIVNGSWFNIAHPWPLRFLLAAMGWLPGELGASRENHIMRSSSVVNRVTYAKGDVTYSTFDAPDGTIDVVRLAFVPSSVRAGGRALHEQGSPTTNGYSVQRLPNGDAIVTIRHDGLKTVSVIGDDPQVILDKGSLAFDPNWAGEPPGAASGGRTRMAQAAGATVSANFIGNQVRLIGRAGPEGGRADVILDGEKQLVGVDCWNPEVRDRQVLYYRNGLPPGPHQLKIVVRGERNPYAQANRIWVDSVQCSAADGRSNYSAGGGPTDTQRMLFGYTGREDYRDSEGKSWRPATEFIIRLGHSADTVKQAWWTEPAPGDIGGTSDPELYRYGVHGREFWTDVTVGPGRYHVRLKFAATHEPAIGDDGFAISINGKQVANGFDVSATAGGRNRAVDLVFNDLMPRHGVIEIRLTGADRPDGAAKDEKGQAFLQALEVGPGDGGVGAVPRTAIQISK